MRKFAAFVVTFAFQDANHTPACLLRGHRYVSGQFVFICDNHYCLNRMIHFSDNFTMYKLKINYIYISLIFFIWLISGCASPPAPPSPIPNKSLQNSNIDELEKLYQEKKVGKIILYSSNKFNEWGDVNFTFMGLTLLNGHRLQSQPSKKKYDFPNDFDTYVNPERSYIYYFPPSNDIIYWINQLPKYGRARQHGYATLIGGQTLYFEFEDINTLPRLTEAPAKNLTVELKGSHFTMAELDLLYVLAHPPSAAELSLMQDQDDDRLCKKYGFQPETPKYAECRMKVDIARRQSEQLEISDTKYQEQLNRYNKQLEANQKENERQRGLELLRIGSGILSGNGQTPSMPSLPPMRERIELPKTDIFIKGQPLINCMSHLNVIDCR